MAELGNYLEKIIGGGTPSKDNNKYWNGNIYWASVKDIAEKQTYLGTTQDKITELGLKNSSSNLIPKGNVIIPTRMGLGRCVVNTVDLAINQDLKALIPKKSLNKIYLLYLMKSLSEQVQLLGCGTTVKGIRIEQLVDLEVNIPTIIVQENVAKILSNYDDLIENNNKRIKILEEMAQKIYKEWFVDFKFPGHETTTFKDSPLGKIPNNWEVKPMEKLLIHQIGGGWGNEIKTDKYNTPAYVIRGTDIPNGRQGCIENCPLRYHTSSNLKTRTLNENDIVFEVSGGSKGQPVGRTLILNKNLFNQFKNNVICASFCKLLRVDQTQIIPEYIYLHLLNIYNNGEIEKYQTQSTGIINFKFNFFLENEKILIPKQNIISKFEKIIKPIFDEIFLLGNKNQVLKQTRDTLLPRLISGEINVENMEII